MRNIIYSLVLSMLISTLALGAEVRKLGVDDLSFVDFTSPAGHAVRGIQPVDMRTRATGGAGTAASPWTGWDGITWAENTTYVFPAGVYSYVTSPNFALEGIRLVGLGKAVLKHTGTGNAVSFDAGNVATLWNVLMENITIQGNANTTNGLYLQSIHHSTFRNIRVLDVSAAALDIDYGVANYFEKFTCSVNEDNFTVTPVTGIHIDMRASDNATTQANTFNDVIIEGVSGTGIYIEHGNMNIFYGGTSEANGKGIQIDASNTMNKFISVDLEANDVGMDIYGTYNSFDGVLDADSTNLWSGAIGNIFTNMWNLGVVTVKSGAKHTGFIGGNFHDIVLDNNSEGTYLVGVIYGTNSGTYIDNTGAWANTKIHSRHTGLDYSYNKLPGGVLTPALGGLYNNTNPPIGATNIRGQVTFAGSGTAAVTFEWDPEPDASYYISLGCDNTAERFGWASKATTGFSITSSNAASTATCDWIIVR